MLHIWYAIAFRFDSHLGDFPFVFFTFFKTFQSVRVGVRFGVRISIGLRVMVRFRVYLLFSSFLPTKSFAATISVAK